MSTVYLQGKILWANSVFNKDTKFDEDGVWKATVALDDPSLDVLSNSGLRLQVKETEDGNVVNFRRKCVSVFKGERVTMDPIDVVDADGNKLTGGIGNGSDVTVKVEVYTSKFGMGHRLEAVRVDTLIPYEGENNEVVSADGVTPF